MKKVHHAPVPRRKLRDASVAPGGERSAGRRQALPEEEVAVTGRMILHLRDDLEAVPRVEIRSLESPDKKERVAVPRTMFIVEGSHGLHDDDAVKVEVLSGKQKE